MQELIDRLEEHLVQSAKGQLLTKRGGDYRIGLRKAIDFANEELEKEKEQIMNDYENGWHNGFGDEPEILNTEEYYNQTYNQNK